MKILADLHHNDLFYSLELLFEKRLGAEVYRPIGLDWWKEGFWKVYDHPATANQFLGLDQGSNHPIDVHGNPLANSDIVNKSYTIEDGIYYVRDISHVGQIQRAITLEKFKEMKFDILISSMPWHVAPYNKLISLYQPQAKHIFQVGNAWGHQAGVKNILASTAPFGVPSDVNACFYHQEFSLDVYKYVEPLQHNIISSYIHYMPNMPLMNHYRSLLPEFKITSYGSGMDDALHGVESVAAKYQDSSWTWHFKPGGDGYGFSLHCSYACGRPALIWGSQYRGKLAEALFQHGKTCIDLELNSPERNAVLIREFSKPDQHKTICQNAHNRFREVVDFDKEFLAIKQFLANLQ